MNARRIRKTSAVMACPSPGRYCHAISGVLREPARLSCVALLSALLCVSTAHSEQEEAAPREFDLDGFELAEGSNAGDLDIEHADAIAEPIRNRNLRWPEDLVIAPVPGRSPQLGWNMKLVGGYFIGPGDREAGTTPSVLGGFAMGAENGSYAYGALANLHLKEDKLRVRLGAGKADIRYRFYGVGNDSDIAVDIVQRAPLYFVSASWRVSRSLYLGLGYNRGNVNTRLRSQSESGGFDPRLDVDIGAYTIPLQIDSRDHEQFPRSGWLVDAEAKLYRESAGSDFDAEVYQLELNHYQPMRDRDVLASRLTVRTVDGNAPFFLLSTFGGSTDLRGYPSGRYRDRMMYAMQSEYRWQVNDRWVLTGFAGFGEIAESSADIGGDFLPAAGIGARFVLSEKHRVGLSADIAIGNDGTEFYLGVGEAF